jgi:hypothetical protein
MDLKPDSVFSAKLAAAAFVVANMFLLLFPHQFRDDAVNRAQVEIPPAAEERLSLPLSEPMSPSLPPNE